MIYSHSCVSSLCAPIKYSVSPKRHVRQSVIPVRAQGFRDHEGSKSGNKNVVDANLSVMRERMKEIRAKEILERCYRSDDYGWNNLKIVDFEEQNKARSSRLGQNSLTGLLELGMIVGGSLGFTFFGGTFFLCLVSLVMHLNQSLL